MNNAGIPNETLRLGLLSLGLNAALMLVKIVAGWLGNSYALIADGIESGGDIVTSLITWAGFRASLKPADENHPWGHGKIEALAGMLSGFSLIAAAALIARYSIIEIRTPHHAPAWFTLPVLVLVVVLKELFSRKVEAAGAALGSTALKGDAWHHRSDAITSAAAAIGIGVALLGGPGWESADDWAALLACVLILFNGGLIFRDALHDLLDGSVPAGLTASVFRIAETTPGVESAEKCRVRKSGVHFDMQIHIRVDPDISVFEGHRISHEAQERLRRAEPRLRDIIIHIEPSARAGNP